MGSQTQKATTVQKPKKPEGVVYSTLPVKPVARAAKTDDDLTMTYAVAGAVVVLLGVIAVIATRRRRA